MRLSAKPMVEKTPVLNQTRLITESATTAPSCSPACCTTWRTGPCVPTGNMSTSTWPAVANRRGVRATTPQKSRTPSVSGSMATNRLNASMPAYMDAPLSRYSPRNRFTARRLPMSAAGCLTPHGDVVVGEPEAERAGLGKELLHHGLLRLHRVLEVVGGPRVEDHAQRDHA